MAEELLNRMWREYEGLGNPVRPGRVTIGQAWKEFTLDWYPGKEPKTVSYYETAARQCLTLTSPLTAPDLERDMQRVRRDERLSPASREIYLRALRTFGKWCVKRSHLMSMPEVRVKVPEKKIETFSGEELMAIIHAAHLHDDEFGGMVELLALTGMRVHEVLELQWSDIADGSISVMSKDGKRVESVPITPAVGAVLKRLPKNKNKLFRWSRATLSRLHRTWVSVLESAGVEHRGRGFHVLRKTRWSQVIAADVNPVVAARLMRASIQTAMKHYIKIDKRDIDKAARAADAFSLRSHSQTGVIQKRRKRA